MRTIICRFRDEADLRDHIIYGAETWRPPEAISFLAHFQATPGEAIKVVLVCEDTEERCVISVVVGPGLAHNRQPLWRYIGRVRAEDRVWLEMFLAKQRTLSRFSLAG